MKISDTKINDVLLISIKGQSIGETESSELFGYIKSKISGGVTKFVIDLSKVKWISSTGLGVLVAALNSVKDKGGNLVLVGVAENVQNLLTITQLMHFFDSSDSIDEAVANFN